MKSVMIAFGFKTVRIGRLHKPFFLLPICGVCVLCVSVRSVSLRARAVSGQMLTQAKRLSPCVCVSMCVSDRDSCKCMRASLAPLSINKQQHHTEAAVGSLTDNSLEGETERDKEKEKGREKGREREIERKRG